MSNMILIKQKTQTWTPDEILPYLLILALMLFVPLNRLIPLSWGQENGVIESLQLFVLLVAAALSWRYAILLKNKQNQRFWHVAIPVWFIMIGREISWGRVFFPEKAVSGEITYLGLDELWYGPVVNPTVGLLLIAFLFAVIRYKLYAVPYRLWKLHRFPLVQIAVLMMFFILSVVIEKHLITFISGFSLNEELPELFAYICFLGLITNIGRLMRLEEAREISFGRRRPLQSQ